jgi:hypothetical protein
MSNVIARLAAAGGLAVVCASCGAWSGSVRQEAANDFRCADQSVQVQRVGDGRYLASGCGQRAGYVCKTERVSKHRTRVQCAQNEGAVATNASPSRG